MIRHLRNLLISNYSAYVAAGLLTPVYALYVLSIGGNAFDAGATNATFYITAGLLMLILAGRQDRAKDRRKSLVAGFLIESIGSLLLLTVNTITGLYAVQVIHAIGVSLWVPALKAAYAKLEDSGHEASEWSWFEGGDHIITGAAALAGGSIIALLSFKITFATMAVCQLISAYAAWRMGRPAQPANNSSAG